MEIFLLILLLLTMVWALSYLSAGNRRLIELRKDMEELQGHLGRLYALVKQTAPTSDAPAPAKTSPSFAPMSSSPTSVREPTHDSLPAVEPAPAPPSPAPVPIPPPPLSAPPVPSPLSSPVFNRPPAPKPAFAHAPTPEPASRESWFDKWLRDNPDIEKFIGENLINKIGIGILVLGIAFFVKYAIDQEWINKVGRVCIGLVCGGILIALAHRLRKSYHSFSSVLVGGGICVFYFTVAFAFHQYQLIGQASAFVIMIVITVFAVLLSVLYDRMEIGVLAALGGFAAPFLVSKGEGNYQVLFTYLTILNMGLIVLAYYKRWRLLNFLAFVFTQVIYLGWLFSRAETSGFSCKGAFLFGTAFYIMFLLMNVIHHVTRNSKLKSFDFIILLSVNLAYYAVGIYLLTHWGADAYRGLFTASLGLINLGLTYIFFRKATVDKNFVYLLIGITLSFISMAAPTQLKGHYITLFWSTETVVLFWLYQKSFIRLLKIASALITLLVLISLFMDWGAVYGYQEQINAAIVNKGFITGLFSGICLLICYGLFRKEADLYYLSGITNHSVRNFYLAGAILIFYISGALEVNDQFTKRFSGSGLQFIYLELYTVTFYLVLLAIIVRNKVKVAPLFRLVLPFILFILYLFNTYNTYSTERLFLISGLHHPYFLASWADDLLLLLMAWLLLQYVRKNPAIFGKMLPGFTWIFTLSLLILITIEVQHLFVWLYYTAPASIGVAENIYGKAGISILWGISSFVIISLGMSHRYKPLRIIALLLFGITLLKLFCYDISNISQAGKIIAFILLGALLLIISFMYQRLKKILLNDQTHQE